MSTQEGREEQKGPNGHKGFKTEGDAPNVEPQGVQKYQLYCDNKIPCQWYLSVDGDEAYPITSHELTVQSRFRNWHLDHQYDPPQSERNTHIFEGMIKQLYAARIKRDVILPFQQTDAGQIENLAQFFHIPITNLLRANGKEFLDGKIGDTVRIKDGRIYFKWQSLKRFCQSALNLNGKDIEELKMFISKKGGYQGEQGARGFYRWTYWVPLEVFDGATQARWLGEEIEDVANGGKSE